MRLCVADLPVLGEMLVMNASDKKVLFREDGDLPIDVGILNVVALYSDGEKIIVEVE